MIPSKSFTFCPYGLMCKVAETCKRVLSDKEKAKAKQWGLPVSYFMDDPDCFVPFYEKDTN